MSIEKIDQSISVLSSLIKQRDNDDVSKQIISECISAFDQLFDDGLEPNSIQTQIDSLIDKNTPETDTKARLLNYEYLTKIFLLKKLIDQLPDDFPFKARITNRLLDHCSSKWLDKIEKGLFTNSPEDFNAFRKTRETVSWNNTVEVRSWGTREEISNGLRNVLRQKVRGEPIGHVALVMRIPVNEANRLLVDKYCLFENGGLKIPLRIRMYGNQPVYEIYWSYWPKRLATMREDIVDERSGFEFTTKSNVINKLPPELKGRYISQKQANGLIGKPKIIDLPPVATPRIGSKHFDKKRGEYVDLKLRYYKLEGEIKSLETLKSKYLLKNKEFYVDSNVNWTEKPIKPSSNFLILLSQFKNELSGKKIYTRILKDKKISSEQAKSLGQNISILIDLKKTQAAKLKEQAQEAAKHIYAPSLEIKNIKKRIKHIQYNLGHHHYLDDLIKQVELLEGIDNPQPSKELVEYLQEIDLVSNSFPKDRIILILDKIKKEKEILPDQMLLKEQLITERDKLEQIYASPKSKIIDLYKKKISEKEEQIIIKEQKLFELLELIKQTQELRDISTDTKKIKELKELCDEEQFPFEFVYDIERELTPEENEKFQGWIDSGGNIWNVTNIEDAEFLMSLIQQHQKRKEDDSDEVLPFEDPIDITYELSREKTEKETQSYGNFLGVIPATFETRPLTKEELISETDSKLSELIEIINQNPFSSNDPVLFEYPMELSNEENASFTGFYDSGSSIWELRDKNDVISLISIVKSYQQRLKEDPLFHPHIEKSMQKTPATEMTTWTIRNMAAALSLVNIFKEDIEKEKTELASLCETVQELPLQSAMLPEQLKEKHIIRGTPTRTVILKEFNIEEMLKKGSELATTTYNFNVVSENCSTTSMRLLNAGAPGETKHMFQWTINTPENPASNAFLTNPQTVHAACTLVSQAQNGSVKAKRHIQEEAFVKPNPSYYIKLNKLLAFRNNLDAMLQVIKANFFSYLRIIPQLIHDLWVSEDTNKVTKSETEVDKFLTGLNDTIRSHNYELIKHENPLLAINLMKEKLLEGDGLTALPFFDVETLEIVREYILNLEATEPKSELETQHINDYYLIMNEREERVNCVELALAEGHDVTGRLVSRTNTLATNKFDQTPAAQAELIVTKFYDEYKKLRMKAIGSSFFRSDFITSINPNATFEEKLKIIHQHVMDNPKSRSAEAWKKCVVQSSSDSVQVINPPEETTMDLETQYDQEKKSPTIR